MYKTLLVVTLGVLLAGCIDSQNGRSIHLGDVSNGQQLIDLKAALDAEAISEKEYLELKAVLIDAAAACENSNGQADEEDDGWKLF